MAGAFAFDGAVPMEELGDTSPLSFGGTNGDVPRTYGQVFEVYMGSGDTLGVGLTVDTNRSNGTFPEGSVRVAVTDAAGNVVHDQFHDVDGVGDTISLTGLTGAAGVWKVDISSFNADRSANDTNLVWDWSITPRTGATIHEGRVWAAERTDTNGLSLYRAQQPNFDAGLVNTAEDVTTYFLSDTGVSYRGTYLDYQGFTSYIGADSLGLADQNCNPAYTSAYGAATGAASLTPGGDPDFLTAGDCDDAVVYRTFFEQPDDTMPATAPSYRGNTWVYNEYEGPAFPTLTGVVPGEDNYAGTQINYTLEGQPGRVLIEVDTSGTGNFTNPLRYAQMATVGANTFTWNGSGTPREQMVHVRVSIEQTGEIHFLNADVENRSGGIQIEQLTGPGAGVSDLNWDDTAINGTPPNSCADLGDQNAEGTMCHVPNPRSTNTMVGDGVNSSGGVHNWGAPNVQDGPTGPWGNVRVIDDWTFIDDAAESEIVLLPVAELPDPDLRVNKEQVGEPVISEDGSTATITWLVEAGNLGEGPATGVRVAEDFPESVIDETVEVIEGPSQGTFSNPFGQGWNWVVGDLEAGQTEEMTLRADVTLSGEAETFVNQVKVSAPGFPAPGPGQPCQVNPDLPGDTDQCDEVETPIEPPIADPDLRINKEQAGEPVISEDGSTATITWTVEAGNLGEGPGSDVVVTDTLPEEADASTLAVVDGPSQGIFDVATATWAVGDLAAGQTEVVTLSADVALSGDPQVFVNQARIGNPEFPPPGVDEPCQVNPDLPGDADQCDEVETPIELDPSLAINKEQVGEAVINDDSTATITWSIEAGNFGPGNTDDVFVADTLPEGVDPASVEVIDGPSQGEFDTATATWAVGDLDRGQTETVTLSAIVPLNGDEQVFVNQARIGNPEFPPPGVDEPCVPNSSLAGDDDQCDEVETPVDPDPELKVNKENVGEPVISDNGSTATVTWLIEAGNTGVGNADDVTVTDTLPEQVNPASVEVVEGPSAGTFDTETMTWTIGELDAGQTESMTLSGVVPLNAESQEIINQARIGNPEFPPPAVDEPCESNPDLPADSDQCDEVPTPLPPTSPDLKINKEAVGEPVFARNGETATITWMVETGNFGDRFAPGVTVTDLLPEEVDPASVEVVDGPTQGSFNAETMVWNVGTLAIGQSESITFSGVVDTTSGEEFTIVNGAYVENPEFPFDPEDPENPCVVNEDLPSDDDRCDEVEVPVPPKNPVLQINKAIEGAPIFSDNGETGTLTWTIQAGNYGDRIARDVTVTDMLPEQVDPATVELVSLSVGEFDAETMVWTIGNLPINRMESITFKGSFPIENGEVIELINTAVIENPQFPRDPEDPEDPFGPCVENPSLPTDDDQCDFVDLPVDPLNPDLKINKAAEGGPVFSDDGQSATISWTIEAGNFGGRTAHDVTVSDVLPEGVDPASVVITGDPSQGEFDTESMVWTIGTLTPGQIETVSFSGVIDVSDGEERNVVNKAYIENPEFPFDPEQPCVPNEGLPGDDDRCDEVEVPVDPNDPDLKINKEVVGDPVISEDGESAVVTWSIEVGNLGARTATEVSVTDILPELVDPASIEVLDGPTQGEFDVETMTWAVGDLLINQVESVTFSGVVDLTSGETEYVVNGAYVENPQFPVDPERPCVPNEDLPSDDDQCDEVEVPFDPTNPDLKINKEAVGEPVLSEDGTTATITWLIETGNFGNRVAHDVTVTDVLPEGVDAATVEVVDGPTQGEFDAESMVWTVGSLAIGQSESMTFSAVVDTTGGEEQVIVNGAYVENPEFPHDPEEPCVANPDLPSDDDRCDEVEVPLDPTNPDLKINKAVVDGPIFAEDGETAVITWSIEAGNFGDRKADEVVVTDVLPEQVDPASVEVVDGPTQGEFDAETMTWNVGTLAIDQVETITFSGVVDTTGGEGITVVNEAYIENPEFPFEPVDPEEPCVPNEDLPGDDDQCDWVEVPVDPTNPDLRINKEQVDEPVIAEDGETAVITWMIETGNFGGRVAHDVTVTDVLPEGVDAETVEVIDGPTQGEFDAESMVWTVGSLAVNQTESISFSAVVDTTPGEETVFVNRAYVENPEFPANPEEPCVPNEDLAGDDDQCDEVETPIAPEKPETPVDPEPEPKPEPKPVDPVKPEIPAGDPVGGMNMLLVGGGGLLLLLGGGAVFLALRRKEGDEEQVASTTNQ